ncbi:hypothetical protein JCM10213_008044 [Rhodosporidiobolus nylandii]
MPLLRRRPVALLPLPNTQGLPSDTRVYYLKATGEIFLDYESYAARLSFLLLRQFQCEYSGKTNLDYFSALQSEKAESRIVRERFPDELKGRVLATVQFRVLGRLDSLVDLVYERYKDRFFKGEKVFVDLTGDKYFAQVSTVFPPQRIRDMLPSSSDPSTSSSVPDYTPVTHKIGTDLNVDAKKARQDDDPDEYLYTVQLMDEEHKFEGSFMEVKAKSLSRDRLAFSKSIMKRYLRECLQRDAAIGAPWIVKPSIARAFGIPLTQNEEEVRRNEAAREGKLAKRRKDGGAGAPGTPAGEGAGAKRRKLNAEGSSTPSGAVAGPSGSPKADGGAKKAIKYPIEDLDLDASSIIDGRILRRVNSEVPSLPVKPQPKKTLLVPQENFDRFIETWNMLNVFAKPLFLSNFTLDDYAGALMHDTLTPRCTLLVEIHASLTNIIGTDNSRALGSTTAVSTHGHGGSHAASAATAARATPTPAPEDGSETPAKEEPNPLETAAQEEEDQEQADLLAYEQSELNRLVRLGISYGKRWDRQAKLKYAEGRDGWERHLIGALCQRGGPIYLQNFVRIMRHLFQGHPDLPPPDEPVLPVQMEEDVKPSLGPLPPLPGAPPAPAPAPSAPVAPKKEEPNEDVEPEDLSNPEQAYLSLSLEDKLDVIGYLCTLVMGSKAVRGYVEESDAKLTELRKERAEVNKERKALLEQKAAISSGKEIPATPSAANGNGDAMEVDSRAPSEAGDAPPSSASRQPATANGDDDEDQLDSDAESTAAPSEAGSPMSLNRRQAGLAQLREAAKAKTKGVVARATIDDKIRTNSAKEDTVEREFRRFQGVARCRPLGKDRFHCRYWWFDGVGGMELIRPLATGGETMVYGTGRLLVQGPSREDWEMIADLKRLGDEGEKQMTERRVEEEVAGGKHALLGVDQWAYYEDEDELDALDKWLNGKGTRELALKTAITKWRTFIVGGAKKRQHDAAHPDLPRYEAPIATGRASRTNKAKAEPERLNDYLGWQNLVAKY